LGYKKPALLHSKFLPALQGANTKMSASNENSAIFMTDDPKKIAKKIKSHAFSGGGATQEDHQKNGGNPDVDVAYQYLSFFEDSDERMETLAKVRICVSCRPQTVWLTGRSTALERSARLR